MRLQHHASAVFVACCDGRAYQATESPSAFKACFNGNHLQHVNRFAWEASDNQNSSVISATGAIFA